MRFNVRSLFFFQFASLCVPVCADSTTTSGYMNTLNLEASSRSREVEEIRRRDHEELVGELRKWVEGLPPMVDRPYLVFVPCRYLVFNLSLRPVGGKVTLTSDHPIASGGSQDIYTGEWTGQEVRG